MDFGRERSLKTRRQWVFLTQKAVMLFFSEADSIGRSRYRELVWSHGWDLEQAEQLKIREKSWKRINKRVVKVTD